MIILGLKKQLHIKTDKKGFTLIEVIVVLVVLAILASIAVPSLVGYIDKSRQRAYIAEARSIQMGLQTISIEAHGRAQHLPGIYINADVTGPNGKPLVDEINVLSGTNFTGTDITEITFDIKTAKLLKFVWDTGSDRAVVFEGGVYTVIYI